MGSVCCSNHAPCLPSPGPSRRCVCVQNAGQVAGQLAHAPAVEYNMARLSAASQPCRCEACTPAPPSLQPCHAWWEQALSQSRLSYSCAIPPSLPLPPFSPATSGGSTPSHRSRLSYSCTIPPSPPFSQPCYKWWEPPYFWAGLRMYDLIAGKEGLEWCRYLTPSQVRHWFP